MLGGPQAGIIVGRKDLVSAMRKHPLTRAFRVDKLTLATLERTLLTYVDGTWRERLPTLRMLTSSGEELAGRAKALAECLTARGLSAELSESQGRVGGGALPSVQLPGLAVKLALAGRATTVDVKLRAGSPPIVCRLVDDCLYFDVRTVLDRQVELLADRVASAVSNTP